jgi:RHS repeat-associated protein
MNTKKIIEELTPFENRLLAWRRQEPYSAWSQSEPAESDFIAAQTVTTDYVSNKIYKNGQLSMLLTEEGYIEKSGSTYTHHYYLKDHLGNHRVVMNASGTVVQATNYYPSGTTIAERQTDQGIQPYKFGGKELDRKDNLNFYDYEARAYDPTLMRFTSTDPMMEKYYGWSPFAYCMNNPVKYTDPTGMYIVGTDGKAVIYDEKNGWSANASQDVQRIGNAMMLTPVGKEVFNSMLGTEFGISMNINPGLNSINDENLGRTNIYTNRESGEITKVDVILYEGGIKDHLDYYKEMGNTPGAKGNTEKAQLLLDQQPTLTERIGQVGVHEGEHATNPIAQGFIVGREAEAEPQAVRKEIQAIRQTTEFHRPLPQSTILSRKNLLPNYFK